jgi:hypothetical protein
MRAPSRRIAIAAVIGATAFSATGAFAASLTLTNDAVGAADAAVVSPCTAARADYTPFYNVATDRWEVDTITVTGTACTGSNLDVHVGINDGSSGVTGTTTGKTAVEVEAGVAVTLGSAVSSESIVHISVAVVAH